MGSLPAWVVRTRAPRTRDGFALDDDARGRLVAAMARDTDADLARFAMWLEPSSLRDFVRELFEGWATSDRETSPEWLVRAIERCLDPELATSLGARIEQWIDGDGRSAAEAGLELLRRVGTESALGVVVEVARRVRPRGDDLADRILAREARSRGLDLDALEDRLVPTFGLDAQGSRTFELGARRVRLVVGAELRAELLEGEGPSDSSTVRQGHEREGHVREGHERYAQLGRAIGETLDHEAERLERALSSGRAWSVHDFCDVLRSHPLLRHLVRRLVWGQYDTREDPAARLVHSFRVDEDDHLTDALDEPAELLADLPVRLVHPADLALTDRAAWGELLADYELLPPFPQLARAVMRPHPEDAPGDTLRRFPHRAIEPASLHSISSRAGWMRGEPDDSIRVRYLTKRFVRAELVAVARLEPGLHLTVRDDEPQTVRDLYFTARVPGGLSVGQAARVPLAEVPPAVMSEVLYDLAMIAD